MERVTGIGGVFFKAGDPKKLQAWHQEQLGILPDKDCYVSFHWREAKDPERTGYTVWSPFPRDTSYFDPSSSPFMINYRVENLEPDARSTSQGRRHSRGSNRRV